MYPFIILASKWPARKRCWIHQRCCAWCAGANGRCFSSSLESSAFGLLHHHPLLTVHGRPALKNFSETIRQTFIWKSIWRLQGIILTTVMERPETTNWSSKSRMVQKMANRPRFWSTWRTKSVLVFWVLCTNNDYSCCSHIYCFNSFYFRFLI